MFSFANKKYFLFNQFFNFATKMRAGVTKNTKDSPGKRLGVKKYGGEEIKKDQIIVRQRGFKVKAGENVHFGKDHTLHASKEGKIAFTTNPWYPNKKKVFVHVIEQEVPNRKVYPPYPFNYHPELYPELAKNNIKAEPLAIKKIVSKKEKKTKESFQFIKAGTIETKLDQLITKYANNKNMLTYTAKHQIEPILDEISEIGRTYFGLKKPDEDAVKREEFDHSKVYDNTFYENPIDLYNRKLEAESLSVPQSLRTTLKAMQDKGEISKSYDLTSIPYELHDSKSITVRGKNNLVDRRTQIIEIMNTKDLPLVEKEMLRRELKVLNSALKNIKERFENFERKERVNKVYICKLISEKYKSTDRKKVALKKKIKI
jgi:large subunit ribosomal protein L27